MDVYLQVAAASKKAATYGGPVGCTVEHSGELLGGT